MRFSKFSLFLLPFYHVETTTLPQDEIVLLSRFLLTRPNFTDNNMHCWLLSYSFYQHPSNQTNFSLWNGVFGIGEFMAYEFQPDSATTDVSPEDVTIVSNDVTLNPEKYGYNSSVDYCTFVTENQLDEPVQQYVSTRLNQVSENSSTRNIREVYIGSEEHALCKQVF